MSKKMGSLCLFLLVLLQMQLSAFALTYTDDFTDNANNNIKAYTNLAFLQATSSSWSAMPDRSVFTFASSGLPAASAIYRVQKAQRVTVGFYTMTGSFYSLMDDGETWVLGLYNENTASLSGKQLKQARYSPSAGCVYADINGSLHKAYRSEESGLAVFKPTTDSPADLIGYGINAYASKDGSSWSPIALEQTLLGYRPGNFLCYEELSGSVPAGAEYVRIDLNDITRLPYLETTGWENKQKGLFSCLASVCVSGADLTVGVPEPLLPEPVLPETSWEDEESWAEWDDSESESSKASSSKTSSSKASSSKSKSTGGTTGTAKSSSSKSSSSKSSSSKSASSVYAATKFEGVIESSAPAGGKKAAASSAASKSSRQESSSQPPAPPPEEPASVMANMDAPVVYQVPSSDPSSNNHFTVGVTVYIIIVTGALAFMVLTSANKRK